MADVQPPGIPIGIDRGEDRHGDARHRRNPPDGSRRGREPFEVEDQRKDHDGDIEENRLGARSLGSNSAGEPARPGPTVPILPLAPPPPGSQVTASRAPRPATGRPGMLQDRAVRSPGPAAPWRAMRRPARRIRPVRGRVDAAKGARIDPGGRPLVDGCMRRCAWIGCRERRPVRRAGPLRPGRVRGDGRSGAGRSSGSWGSPALAPVRPVGAVARFIVLTTNGVGPEPRVDSRPQTRAPAWGPTRPIGRDAPLVIAAPGERSDLVGELLRTRPGRC
jgi:hypothetical protein